MHLALIPDFESPGLKLAAALAGADPVRHESQSDVTQATRELKKIAVKGNEEEH